MGAKQIFKISALVIILLLAVAIFVCGMILGKKDKIDIYQKNTRLILRIRVGCFLAMLILLFLMFVIQ